MDNRLTTELAARASDGMRPVSVAVINDTLARLGYRLERSLDCRSENRYMSGARAGLSYPAINAGVVEADTRMSAFHYQARRDANFAALQALRRSGELFALSRGRILEF